MAKNEISTPKKTKWLHILEQQSWQAGLIISGIAIVGSMQLSGLIFESANKVLVMSLDKSLRYFGYFFIYLLTGVRLLIFGFIIHFVMRALWVGMLGLVSVFPQGIRETSTIYS